MVACISSIGPNGSGKSNLVEILNQIFKKAIFRPYACGLVDKVILDCDITNIHGCLRAVVVTYRPRFFAGFRRRPALERRDPPLRQRTPA